MFSPPLIADKLSRQLFEQNFATAALLSDGDSLTLGIANFDPESLLSDSNENIDSIDRRNSLKIFTIPYSYKFSNSDHNDRLHFSFSYIEQKSKIFLFDASPAADDNIDEFYNFYSGYLRSWALNEKWVFDAGIGSFLMHHSNTHTYNSPISKNYQSELDGEVLNLTSNTILLKPNFAFSYTDLYDWGKWTFKSDYEYFYGWTFKGAKSSQGATPESWKIANTIKVHFKMYHSEFNTESLFLKAKRVDIGGDVVESFNTYSYYEFGAGVLFNTKKMTTLVDNVGIGLNLNIGSSLTGGSIVFYVNEI